MSVLQEVDSQPYIHTFLCRAEFWEKFKASDTLAELCKALGGLYCAMYKQLSRVAKMFAHGGVPKCIRCVLIGQ